ncbi:MAG: hypothetical protein IBX70_02130 [Clostridia bacterium]|nr:hypothetical protein [Clostridia bacterium]
MNLKWKSIIDKNEQRGSSSVLVIMVLLMLITFGVLAMMTSYSNLKISRKNAEWTQAFYKLESLARYHLAEVETHIIHSADFADEYIEEMRYKEPSPQGFDYPWQDEVYKKWLVSEQEEAFIDEIRAWIFEKNLMDSFSLMDIEYELDLGSEGSLAFVSTSEDNRHFWTRLQIDEREIALMEWREIPEVFEYDEVLEFTDPGGK